ncbi:glycosyltransferase family 2 protein [Patescibacteria group bacterium]|nr:glycosyltransferase family 2 protein [Patescibacteria group bacterium]
MNKNVPSVAIITINLNLKRLTESFIDEVEKQSYPSFHLYIIDNGSLKEQKIDDKSLQAPWLTYHQLDKNTGFTGGNNKGIELALKDGHKFIWLVNNDTSLELDCLEKLVDCLGQNPQVGIVGPKILYENPPDIIWFAGGKINWKNPFPYTVCTHIGERIKDKGQFNESKEVDFITGCSMLIRREVLEKIGRLDDDYFAYFEDSDFCLRAKNAGWMSNYCPQAIMRHQVGALSGVTSPRSSYYQIRNSLLFVTRWGTLSSQFLAYLNAVIITFKNIIKLLIPAKRAFARAQLRAVFDFARRRFGGLEETNDTPTYA